MLPYRAHGKHRCPCIIKTHVISLVILYLLCSSPFSLASNLLVEKSIAEQLAKSGNNENLKWLKAGTVEFLALYQHANIPKARGGLILLHGMGAHPDWSAVISPLRKKMSEHGWSTLSIQMPALEPNATPENYIPLLKETPERITSAIEFLHARGVYNIVVLGHGLGATMGANYLATNQTSSTVVKAFVAVGLGLHSHIQEFSTAQYIARIRIPMLDIFGSQDLDSIQKSAKPRLLAARSVGNGAFRQTSILGADHFFNGMDDLLVNRVRSWLNRYAPSVKIDTNDAKKFGNQNNKEN